jgi:hypothetical protein
MWTLQDNVDAQKQLLPESIYTLCLISCVSFFPMNYYLFEREVWQLWKSLSLKVSCFFVNKLYVLYTKYLMTIL